MAALRPARLLPLLLLLIALLLALLPGSTAQFQENAPVNNNNHDCEQNASSGTVNAGSSDLEICEDGAWQYIYMRFEDVNIPSRAIVDDAFIWFYADDTNTGGSPSMTIRALESDDAPACSTANSWISSRPTTAASVVWNNAPGWTDNNWYTTVSFPTVVDEVIQRTGFFSGAELAIILSPNDCNNKRRAGSHDDNSAKAPELEIDWWRGATDLVWTTNVGGGAYYGDQAWNTFTLQIRDSVNQRVEAGPDSTLVGTLTLSGPGGVFSSATTLTATAANGIISFTAGANDVKIDPVGLVYGDYSVTVSVTNYHNVVITSPASNTVTVQDRIAGLAFATMPGDGLYGVTLAQQPVVNILDVDGNVITQGADRDVNLVVELASGSGTLNGNIQHNCNNGVCSSFSFDIRNGGFVGGTFTLRAKTSAGGNFPVVSDPFDVWDSVASVQVVQQPSDIFADEWIDPAVSFSLMGDSGNKVTDGPQANATVFVNLQAGTGTLDGVVSVAAVFGDVTFNLTVIEAGLTAASNFQLRATETSFSSDTVDTGTFGVFFRPDALDFTQQPSTGPMQTGDVFATLPEVTILYNSIAVTAGPGATLDVTLSIVGSGATLLGTTVDTANNGVADNFSGLNINPVGFLESMSPIRLMASVMGGAITVNSDLITVNTVVVGMQVIVPPEGYPASIDFTGEIHVVDVNGNLVTAGPDATAYSVQITGVSFSGAADGDLTGIPTAAVATTGGIALFPGLQIGGASYVFEAGGFVLDAADSPSSLPTAASVGFDVYRVPTSIVFVTQPEGLSTVSGDALDTPPVLELLDVSGARVTDGYYAECEFSASISTGTGTVVAGDALNATAGLVTFSSLAVGGGPGLFTPGAVHQLTFTLSGALGGALGVPDVVSNTFTVNARAVGLTFATEPSLGQRRGDALGAMVHFVDQDGATVAVGPHATLTADIALSAGTGTIAGTLSTAAVAGEVDFSDVNVDNTGFTKGSKTLTASCSAPSFSMDSTPFFVHNKATEIAVTAQPSHGDFHTLDLATPPEFELRDNGVLVDTGPDKDIAVTLTVSNGVGQPLGADVTGFFSSGVYAPTAVQVGFTPFFEGTDFRLQAASLGVTPAETNDFAVFDTVDSLAIVTEPSTTTAVVNGVALTGQPAIEILGAGGSRITLGPHAALLVDAALSSGTGVLGGTGTVTAGSGLASFTDLDIHGGVGVFSPGPGHQLQFSLNDGPLAAIAGSVTSTAFTVHAAAAAIIISGQPTDGMTRAGPINAVVRILDQDGAVVASGDHSSLDIVATVASGVGTMNGGTATATNGIASVTGMALDMPFVEGSFVFNFATATGPSFDFDSTAFTVYYSATQIGVQTEPVHDDFHSIPLNTQATFVLQDSDGSDVLNGPDASKTATIGLSSGTGALSGTTAVTFASGVYTTDFTIDTPMTPATNFRLQATSAGLTSATTANFEVYDFATSLVRLQDIGHTGEAATGETLDTQPQLEIRGATGRITLGPHASLDVVATVDGDLGTVSGTPTVSASAGLVTYTDVGFDYPSLTLGFRSMDFELTNTGLGIAGVTGLAQVEVFAALSQIVFTSSPGNTIFSNTLTPSLDIELQDFLGALVLTPEDTLTVTIAISTGAGALVGEPLSKAATAATVSWAGLSVDNPGFVSGTFVISASATGENGVLTTGYSAPFDVYGLFDDVIILTHPAHDGVRGDPFSTFFEVEIVDVNDNRVGAGPDANIPYSISLTGPGVLSGPSASGLTAAGYILANDLIVDGPGFSYSTAFSFDVTVNGVTKTSNTFTVYHRVTSLDFTVEPVGGVVSGDPLPTFPAVLVLDGAVAVADGPHASGSMGLTISSGSGAWSGAASETVTNGVATWSAGDIRYPSFAPGAFVFEADFGGLSSQTSAPFTIHARGTDLVWFVQPFGDVLEDVAITQPVVDIVDFDNNRVMTGPQADMVVSLAQSGTGVGDVTPATPTATAAAGRATFAGISIGGGTFVPSANFEFTASTATPEALTSSVASQLFEIFPKAHLFVIATQPDGGPLLSGTAFVTDPVVEVHHTNGGLITRGPFATSTITVSLGNGFGSLVAGAQNTQVTSGGSATFAGLSVAQPGLTQAATFTLDFDLTSPAVAPAVALSSTTMEVHDRAAAIVFTTQPVGDRMDQDLATPPSVAVHDVNGNVITVGDHSDEPITLSLNGLGTLGGTATISATNGEVTPWTALQVTDPNFEQGSFTLTATVLGAISVTSNAFIVGGTAASLFFATQPVGDVYDGVVFDTTPIVHILDRNDSLITDGSHATLTIDVALVAANAPVVLGGTLSLAAIGGIASFSDLLVSPAAFQPSDAFQIEATTPVLVPTYESDNFEVFGQVASLSFSPSLATEMQTDEPFAPDQEVEILHSSGARLTSGPDSTLSITVVVSGALSLTATAMLVAFEGVATFSGLMVDPLTMPAGGTGQLYRLEGSVTGATGTSTDTTIHAVGTSLVFTLDPIGNVYATELLTTMPVVEIRDANNNIVDTGPDSILDVELTLVGGPAGTLLLGTTTETLSAGSVTWTDLAVNQTAYPVDRTFALAASPTTLLFSTTSVTFDIFEAFVVGPIPATQTHSEPSVAGTFSFELILQPLADVTIALSANVDVLGNDMLVMDGVDGTANTSFAHELVFDGINWSVPRTVSLTGIDNDIDEVNDTHVITVNTTILTTDTRYDRWTIPRPVVLIMDDDVVGITGPSQVNHTIENEDGGTSRFSLVLESEPISLVTISVSSTGSEYPNLIALNTPTGSRFTFGPANWDVPLTATLRAIDNDLPKGTQEFDINIAVSSGDPSYDDMPVENLRVSIDDDDADKIPFIPEFDPIEIIVNSGQEVVNRIDWFFVNSTFFPIEEVRVNTPPAALSGFEEDETPSIAFRWSHSHHYGNLSFIASERIGKYVVYFTAVYAGGEMTTPSRPIIIDVQPTPTPEFRTISRLNGPAQGGSVVTITGNYFGLERENLTEVTFAGIPCQGEPSDLWQNIKTIVCTTSEASEFRNDTGPIFVKTSLGEASTGTRFIWTYNPDPEIHAVSQWSMGNAVLSPILIAGKNFGFQESDVNDVKFAGQSCETIVYINTSAMLCTPQQVTQPEIGPVEVFTESHGYVASEQDFRYLMPVVELVTYHRSIPSQSWVVTVAGRDFGPSPVTNVTFEGVDCLSFTELAPEDDMHRVECRMPIGWVSNPDHPCVQVVSADGGLGVCAADIVHEYPLPTVTSISPSRMSVTDSGIEYITIHGHDFGLTADSFVNASMDTSRVDVRTPLFCTNGDAQWISPEEVRCLLPDTGLNAWSQDNKVHISAFVGLETQNGRGPRNTRFTFDPARYPPPVISDITPKVGSAVPLDVTLTGEFFGLLGNDSITIEFQGPYGFAKCLEPTWKSPEMVACKSPRFFDFNMTVDDNQDRTYPFRITVGDETSAIVDRGFEYQLQLNTPVLLSVAPTILPLEGGLGWIFAHQIDIQVFGYVGEFEQFATESSTEPIEFVTNICLSEDRCIVEEEDNAGRLRQMFNDTVDPGSAGGTNGTSGGDVDVPDVMVPEEPIEEEEAEEVYTVVVERGDCGTNDAACLFEANGFPISTELRASLVKECEGLILCRAILVKFPPQPEEGLYSITFERIDREEAGFDTIENVLFYTGGCAEDGKWGPSRTDCRDCPKGGICTGGSSVAAAPGYWTPNPGSDYVVECYPQERCLGGANGDCAEGYDGEVCGRCADGYYLYAQVCKDCPPKLTVLIFLVVAAVVWTFFCFVVYYVKKRTTLSFLVSFLMGVQILAAIGDMTPNKAPTWIQVPAWFLKLFMADFSFIVFDCWRYVPFWVYYLLGLAYSLAVIVLMYIVGKVFQGMRLSYYRNHGTKATYEERALYYRDRLTRAFSIGFQVIYLTLVTRGLEVLSCTQRVDGQWRLVVRQDVLCYEGDHWISGGVAIGILVLIGLGYPLGYLWFMLKYRHKETDPVTGIVSGGLWRNESFMERYNFGYSLFKREHEGFFFMEIAVLIGLAGAKAHLATHPRYQMGVPVLFFLMKLGLVIFYRPYEHVKFNLIQMLICLGAMTALCANWFYNVEWINHNVPSLMAFAVAALFGLAYVWLIFNIGVAIVAPPEEVGGTYLEDDISDDDFFTEIKEEMPAVIGASEVFQYGMMKSIDEQEALAGDSIYVLGPDGLPIEDEEGDYVLTRKEIARRRLDETYEPTLLEWVDIQFFDDDDYADEIAEILAEREAAMVNGISEQGRARRRSSMMSIDASFGIGDSDSDSENDSLSARTRAMSGGSEASHSMSFGDELDAEDEPNDETNAAGQIRATDSGAQSSSVPPLPVLEAVVDESHGAESGGNSGSPVAPGKGKMMKGKGKMMKGKGKMMKGKGKMGKGKFGKGKSP